MIDPHAMTGPLWILLFLFIFLPLCFFTVAFNMERTRRRFEKMKDQAESKRSREDFRL
jgi:hypothetical protein